MLSNDISEVTSRKLLKLFFLGPFAFHHRAAASPLQSSPSHTTACFPEYVHRGAPGNGNPWKGVTSPNVIFFRLLYSICLWVYLLFLLFLWHQKNLLHQRAGLCPSLCPSPSFLWRKIADQSPGTSWIFYSWTRCLWFVKPWVSHEHPEHFASAGTGHHGSKSGCLLQRISLIFICICHTCVCCIIRHEKKGDG